MRCFHVLRGSLGNVVNAVASVIIGNSMGPAGPVLARAVLPMLLVGTVFLLLAC